MCKSTEGLMEGEAGLALGDVELLTNFGVFAN
jgi:hypothetical protein